MLNIVATFQNRSHAHELGGSNKDRRHHVSPYHACALAKYCLLARACAARYIKGAIIKKFRQVCVTRSNVEHAHTASCPTSLFYA